jgi:hypothetical protein
LAPTPKAALAENLIRAGQAADRLQSLLRRDHPGRMTDMLLQLAYLGVTTTFALFRLLPVSNRAKDARCRPRFMIRDRGSKFPALLTPSSPTPASRSCSAASAYPG